MAKAATSATEVGAGLKTPGSGSFSDPVQVGQMIQQMYPEYGQFDAATIGQRWIAKHTPQAPSGGGVGADVLQAPDNSSNPYAYSGQDMQSDSGQDLSGLMKFAAPIKTSAAPAQPKPISVSIPQVPGMNQLTQGNQLAQQANNAPSWLGNQVAGVGNKVASYFQAPKLQAVDISKMKLGGS